MPGCLPCWAFGPWAFSPAWLERCSLLSAPFFSVPCAMPDLAPFCSEAAPFFSVPWAVPDLAPFCSEAAPFWPAPWLWLVWPEPELAPLSFVFPVCAPAKVAPAISAAAAVVTHNVVLMRTTPFLFVTPRAFVFARHNPGRAAFVPGVRGRISRNMNGYSAQPTLLGRGGTKQWRDVFTIGTD